MAERAAHIRQLAEANQALEGPLLPVLHAVQDAFGYLPDETVPVVADVLNLSRAEVHGVISFYHLFRRSPPGKRVLYLCRAEACQAMGGAALADRIKQRLGIDFHQTTADGEVSLEPIYCLGNCACAPAAMMDGTLLGRVDDTVLETLFG